MSVPLQLWLSARSLVLCLDTWDFASSARFVCLPSGCIRRSRWHWRSYPSARQRSGRQRIDGVHFTALVPGNSPLSYKSGLFKVHESLAWLSQIALFLMPGLLVFPSQLLPVAGIGLAVALFLAFVACPIAVLLCLLPLRFDSTDVAAS